jgi:hypothetical protein
VCLNPDELGPIRQDLPFNFSLKNWDLGSAWTAPQAGPGPDLRAGGRPWRARQWNRQARPLARGGRPGAGPPARPPRVAAGILPAAPDAHPGHAQNGRVPEAAVTPLALAHGGHGSARSDALIPLLAFRTAELSPAPAPAPRHFAFGSNF